MVAEVMGTVEGGVVKLDEALPFPDKTRVKLRSRTGLGRCPGSRRLASIAGQDRRASDCGWRRPLLARGVV